MQRAHLWRRFGAPKRFFSDLGPGRKDYSDPCFERKGYVHEGCFGDTVKVKYGKGDRRGAMGPNFVSHSWGTDSRQRILERERMKLEGFQVKDKTKLLENQNGSPLRPVNRADEVDEDEEPVTSSEYPYTGGRLEEIASRKKQATVPLRPKKLSYAEWKKLALWEPTTNKVRASRRGQSTAKKQTTG